MNIKKGSENAAARINDVDTSKVGLSRPVRRIKKLVVAIVVLVVAIAIVITAGWLVLTGTGVISSAKINKDEYQAVFLTNGQVYFGKLQNANGGYLNLEKIYYLQVDESIQSGTTAATTASTDGSNVQLIKLGNELHGPEDQMQISSKQVLFWENLKGDSKVAKAIESYATTNK